MVDGRLANRAPGYSPRRRGHQFNARRVPTSHQLANSTVRANVAQAAAKIRGSGRFWSVLLVARQRGSQKPEFGLHLCGIGHSIRDFLAKQFAVPLAKPVNRNFEAPSEVFISRASATYGESESPRRNPFRRSKCSGRP